MGNKLAIRGHSTRDKEVIELLEMLGGKSTIPIGAISDKSVYVICEGEIFEIPHYNIKFYDFVIFTLEEFLEKYPYKVGDIVKTDKDEEGVIKQMRWVDNDIVYWANSYKTCDWTQTLSVDVLDKYNRLNLNDIEYSMETNVESSKRNREDVLFDSIIWHLRNSVNNGKQNLSGGDCEAYFRELVKKVKMYKSAYPKTYKECCDILSINNADSVTGYKYFLLANFQILLVCRDAYWKIAGEQMGLDKPWEPDWTSGKPFFCISVNGGMISKGRWYIDNKILAFPTEELRDIFYENFKDLIEQCKELL